MKSIKVKHVLSFFGLIFFLIFIIGCATKTPIGGNYNKIKNETIAKRWIGPDEIGWLNFYNVPNKDTNQCSFLSHGYIGTPNYIDYIYIDNVFVDPQYGGDRFIAIKPGVYTIQFTYIYGKKLYFQYTSSGWEYTFNKKDKLTINFPIGKCIDVYAIEHEYPSNNSIKTKEGWEEFINRYITFDYRIIGDTKYVIDRTKPGRPNE